MAADTKAPARVELQPPSHAWISWAVFLAYLAVFVEGLVLNLFAGADAAGLMARVASAQFHLCTIYVLETVMAIGPGWCAMSPGWTCSELLQHHVPYTAATALAFTGGHAERWTSPMMVVLLTALNEALFIANGLGGPGWLAKARRLFGFGVVAALLCTETATLMRNTARHVALGSDGVWPAAVDQLVWGGIYYHALLLRMYIRRWTKKRTL